jgi:hypothetical protein
MTGRPAQLPHAGIAEYGKLCALRGDHAGALRHYREAMGMAVRAKVPEVVFRHYLECSLESLEHMRAYADVVAYCDRAIEHYRERPPENPLARLDLASIHQRRGVVLFKQGDRAGAGRALELARAAADAADARLPLAETLLRWLRSELTVTAERIAEEQLRHKYFSVRKDMVKESRAVPLPGGMPFETRLGQPRGGP